VNKWKFLGAHYSREIRNNIVLLLVKIGNSLSKGFSRDQGNVVLLQANNRKVFFNRVLERSGKCFLLLAKTGNSHSTWFTRDQGNIVLLRAKTRNSCSTGFSRDQGNIVLLRTNSSEVLMHRSSQVQHRLAEIKLTVN
jgi:hypothetical protein